MFLRLELYIDIQNTIYVVSFSGYHIHLISFSDIHMTLICDVTSFFIYLYLCWIFIAARRLSLVEASGDYFLLVVHGLLLAVYSPVAEHWH